MSSSVSAIIILLSALLCNAQYPPDFRLDEVQVLNVAQNPQLGITLPGYSLSADPVDGLHFITGSVPVNIPQLLVSAYIYGPGARSSSPWIREKQLFPPSGFTGSVEFGSSVSMYGAYAVVSDALASSADFPNVMGFVYVYHRLGSDWTQVTAPSIILANPSGSGCKFGNSVSLYGTRVLVSCNTVNVNGSSGNAYLFDVTTGALVGTFVSNGVSTRSFGKAVALSANIAVVSQPIANNTVDVNIYDLINNVNYTITRDVFNYGRSLSADGTSVLVGSAGYAELLSFNATLNTYIVEKTFTGPSDLGYPGTFGTSVALLGQRAFIGAPAVAGKVQSSGASFVYYKDPTTNVWGPGILVAATDGNAAAQYGWAVSITASQLFVGSFGAVCDTCIAFTPGIVYVYDQSNSCGTPPILDSPTVCSSLLRLYYFNPNLVIQTPVTLATPIIFIGNLNITANITTYINGSATPITALGCVVIDGGSIEVQLSEIIVDNVVVVNSRCISGEFDSAVVKASPDDCRTYSVKGQQIDQVTGSLSLLLDTNDSACPNDARRNKIIAGSVAGGFVLIAALVGVVFILAYKLRWSWFDSLFHKRDDETVVHV